MNNQQKEALQFRGLLKNKCNAIKWHKGLCIWMAGEDEKYIQNFDQSISKE
jgi:hypothetical protein